MPSDAASIARIVLYPIKSLDGVSVTAAAVGPAGNLAWDRRYAIVTPDGRRYNGKHTGDVALVQARYAGFPTEPSGFASGAGVDSAIPPTVSLSRRGDSPGPPIVLGRSETASELGEALTSLLGQTVAVIENAERGLPDDDVASGLTMLGQATCDRVAADTSRSSEEIEQRFRANVIVNGWPAFGEEAFVREAGPGGYALRLGAATVVATNVCRRCIVISRNPTTGVPTPGFAATFLRSRVKHWPASSPDLDPSERFRLAINTRPLHSRDEVVANRDEDGDARDQVDALGWAGHGSDGADNAVSPSRENRSRTAGHSGSTFDRSDPLGTASDANGSVWIRTGDPVWPWGPVGHSRKTDSEPMS